MTGQTILIVEDDQPTRELYKRELSANYTVLACANDQDALDVIRTSGVCAVILEPSLPGEAGWNLLKHIRSTPDMQSLPIILCSTLSARHWAMALGATLYLVKPVLPAELLKALRQVLPLTPSPASHPPQHTHE